MAFRTKGVAQILSKLISFTQMTTNKITDYNVGSAVRSLYESVALQIEEFYYDMREAVKFAIRNSAFHAFGFRRAGATFATGNVTIYYRKAIFDPVIIPAGTEFNTGKMRQRKAVYISTKHIKLEAGTQAAIIPVRCTEYGKVGNAVEGEICKLGIGNVAVDFVANAEPLTDGKDRETEAERRLRFREYVHTLQRGTKDAIAYCIKQVDGISGVWVDDGYVGFVRVYCHDANGDLSDSLRLKVDGALHDYRSAGIEVEVRGAVKRLVDIKINISYRDGVDRQLYDVLVASLIERYINQLSVSEDLNMSTLITVINDTYRDVIAYIDVLDEKDIITEKIELLRAGNVVVNESQNIVEEEY